MKHIIRFLVILLFATASCILSQTSQWRTLPNAPSALIKLDDCFFVDPMTGWAVSGLSTEKRIYKTTNGGINWVEQYSANYSFRCVGFINSLTGWVGTLTYPNVMIRTTNGGVNWAPYTLPFPLPQGICGIHVQSSTNIFACGKYSGTPIFIKSTNGGVNWANKNLSPQVTSLVDCYFVNKDSGFVVGGLGLPIHTEAIPVILFTSNGGDNWVTSYTGTLKREWCWKISFLNRDTAFVAIESYRFSDSISYLRTNNRGASWQEHRFKIDTNIYHVQGIGFVSPMVGWIGGYLLPESAGGVTDGKTYETTDGGISWHPVTWGFNINRIRFLSDTLAYAVGRTVYKYSTDSTIGIWGGNQNIPKDFTLFQNYPNPFNPETKIKYQLTVKSPVSIIIYDINGREIFFYNKDSKPAGDYEFDWRGIDMQGQDVSSGVYFYKIETEKFSEAKKMVLVR